MDILRVARLYNQTLIALNQMDELPVYGNDSRVKCKNLRGPWQEVEIRPLRPGPNPMG